MIMNRKDRNPCMPRPCRRGGRRDRLGEAGERGLDAIDGGQDVRARLAPHDEQHRARAVAPGGQPVVLDVVEHLGHVAEAHGAPAAGRVGDHQAPVGVGAEQLIVGRQVVGGARAGEDPLRLVAGLRGQRQRLRHPGVGCAARGRCALSPLDLRGGQAGGGDVLPGVHLQSWP